MMRANVTDADNKRAARAMLGFIHGDPEQIHAVMDEAAHAKDGSAALVLALAETAAGYLIGLLGSEDEAAKQLSEHVMTFVSKETNE